MTRPWRPRPARSTWPKPALASAAATALVLMALHSLTGGTSRDSLPRSRVDPPPASASSPAAGPTLGATASHGDFGRAHLHLRGDGLELLNFGAGQRDVVNTLTDLLGPPDEETGESCDHEGARSHWVRWADLSLRFTRAGLVGYIEGIHYPPGSPPVRLATTRGLRPGARFARARQIYRTSLPPHRQPMGPGRPPVDLFTVVDPPGSPPLTGVVETIRGQLHVTGIFAGDLCPPRPSAHPH